MTTGLLAEPAICCCLYKPNKILLYKAGMIESEEKMVYFEYLKNAFKSQMYYRMNWGMKIMGIILSVFLQLCLWNVLANGHSDIVSMSYMVEYILLGCMVKSLTASNVVDLVNGHIGSGQIAMDMVKPVRFQLYMFCESLGNGLFSCLFEYFPVVVIFSICMESFGLWGRIDIFFLVSTLLGLCLYFALAYCLALTGFWWTQTWILGRFLNDLTGLFSGKMVPVWMFPKVLLSVSRCLPFQYMYYVPISMVLEDFTLMQKCGLLGVQLFWCLFFLLLGKAIERRGMYKLQIQGG